MMFYIGQTGRAFIERYTEHLPKTNTNIVNQNYARFNTRLHFTDFKTHFIQLHFCKKGRYINAAETS